MNKILCFDVSNSSCSVAISSGQEILSYDQELTPSMQAEKLLVMIENTLSKVSLEYKDIDFLAVTLGPGSFTGIRVGLATAYGILYAGKIRGIGLTNFETAFYRLKMQVESFDTACIILNAYRNQLYVQDFTNSGIASPPHLLDINLIKQHLKSKTGRVACAGNGLQVIYEEIKDLNNLIILPRFPTIRTIHIARLANEKIIAGEISKIEPLYIRFPDAIPPQ